MNQDLITWLEQPFNNELLGLGAVGLRKKWAKTDCIAPHIIALRCASLKSCKLPPTTYITESVTLCDVVEQSKKGVDAVQQCSDAKSVTNQQVSPPSSQHVVSKASLRAFCPSFFSGAETFLRFLRRDSVWWPVSDDRLGQHSSPRFNLTQNIGKRGWLISEFLIYLMMNLSILQLSKNKFRKTPYLRRWKV